MVSTTPACWGKSSKCSAGRADAAVVTAWAALSSSNWTNLTASFSRTEIAVVLGRQNDTWFHCVPSFFFILTRFNIVLNPYSPLHLPHGTATFKRWKRISFNPFYVLNLTPRWTSLSSNRKLSLLKVMYANTHPILSNSTAQKQYVFIWQEGKSQFTELTLL